MTNKTADTYTATIYIAGDLDKARDVVRKFCMEGFCVTVTQTEFFYTMGSEAGVAVGLINYPRFPVAPHALRATAYRLGQALLEELCQGSYTVVCPDQTEFVSRRPYDQ